MSYTVARARKRESIELGKK